MNVDDMKNSHVYIKVVRSMLDQTQEKYLKEKPLKPTEEKYMDTLV